MFICTHENETATTNAGIAWQPRKGVRVKCAKTQIFHVNNEKQDAFAAFCWA